MSDGLASTARPELVARVEQHCVAAWPATYVEHCPDGWIMRATPGLETRGRSNHTLAPARTLTAAEIDRGIDRALSFARAHQVRCGIQVSPTDAHAALLDELTARGWEIKPPTLVMTSAVASVIGDTDSEPRLEFADHVTPEWFAAWRACDPARENAAAHIDTAFAMMAGTARFAHFGNRSVGIVAERNGLAALFCLAVHPDYRRRGLGTRLVRGLLADAPAETVYLQVASGNEPGLRLYESLGFVEAYQYCHCIAPASSV